MRLTNDSAVSTPVAKSAMLLPFTVTLNTFDKPVSEKVDAPASVKDRRAYALLALVMFTSELPTAEVNDDDWAAIGCKIFSCCPWNCVCEVMLAAVSTPVARTFPPVTNKSSAPFSVRERVSPWLYRVNVVLLPCWKVSAAGPTALWIRTVELDPVDVNCDDWAAGVVMISCCAVTDVLAVNDGP